MLHPDRRPARPHRRTRLTGGPRRLAAAALGLTLALSTVVASTMTGALPAYAVPQVFDPGDCETYPAFTPKSTDNWAAERLQLAKAHRLATGVGTTIAIIDTGVDPLNLSFRKGQVTTLTVAPNEEDEAADCLHGTGVASLIASQPGSDPEVPFVGVAPGVTILALRSLPDGLAKDPTQVDPEDDRQALAWTIEAVDYAVDQGVDIISISQQGSDTPDYRRAIARAVGAGILVVAAAGNLGKSSVRIYPAAYPGVMAVGMTTQQDVAPPQSQYAPELTVSVSAPGFNVLMLKPSEAGGRSYATDAGTSFATPLVAGAAALVRERFPSMTAAQVKRRLEVTADPPAAAVPDPQLGWGIINPYRALTDPLVDEPSTVATPVPQAGETPRSPLDREPVDHTQRNIAIAVAAGSMGALLVASVVAASLPAGRRRRWRPGDRG